MFKLPALTEQEKAVPEKFLKRRLRIEKIQRDNKIVYVSFTVTPALKILIDKLIVEEKIEKKFNFYRNVLKKYLFAFNKAIYYKWIKRVHFFKYKKSLKRLIHYGPNLEIKEVYYSSKKRLLNKVPRPSVPVMFSLRRRQYAILNIMCRKVRMTKPEFMSAIIGWYIKKNYLDKWTEFCNNNPNDRAVLILEVLKRYRKREILNG